MQPVISYVAFTLIERDAELRALTLDYFYIYIWSAPAVLGLYTLNGWYIGMQNAKIPMYIAIGINVVNISLCFLFVYGFGMQLKGVALASLCAQYAGFIASLILCNVQFGHFRKYLNFSILKDLRSYIPFFRVNRDIFIRTLALIAVTTFFISTSAKYGSNVLAVNALLMQFFTLFSFIMDGFAYSAEALTGRFIGAKDRLSLRSLIRSLFVWGVGIALCFTLVYALFADQIIGLLTDKPDVLALSREYEYWALLFPLAGFAAFLWDGIFIGAMASRQMRNSMLMAASCFFALYFLLDSTFHNNALWISFISYLIIRGVMQFGMAGNILKR